MRTIKFRAWNGHRMYSDERIKELRNLQKLISLSHVHVMQFTGFHDADGKEIYDGDIISEDVETDEGVMQSKAEVFFDERRGAWAVDYSAKLDRTWTDTLAPELRDFKYRVTGNIYQS